MAEWLKSTYPDVKILFTSGYTDDMIVHHGVLDPDVPWKHAERLVSCLAGSDVVLTLIKDGDHRLSRPEDIARMLAAVKEF